MSLWWDLWKVRELAEDLQQRVGYLRQAAVQELGQVPDWVFPLERELERALEQVPEHRFQLDPQSLERLQPHLDQLQQDPVHQQVLARLAVSEAQDRVQQLEQELVQAKDLVVERKQVANQMEEEK